MVYFKRTRRPEHDPTLYLSGNYIECVPNFKFLCIIFYSKMTWKAYIMHICARKSRLHFFNGYHGTYGRSLYKNLGGDFQGIGARFLRLRANCVRIGM